MNPFWMGNPASIGQQTLAGQMIVAGAGNGSRTGRKRAKKRRASSVAPRTRKAKRKTARRKLVKGSAAAKAYMAKIRRKRRK